MSDKLAGGCYKFEDYYSAFDLPLPTPIDTRSACIDESLINEVVASYSKKEISAIQDKLVEVFNNIKI